MKVKCVDTYTPRSDYQPGPPTHITEGSIYEVVEVLDTQYTLLNDSVRLGRYSKSRFEVVDNGPILNLRTMFNTLVAPLRVQLNASNSKLDAANKKIAALEKKLLALEQADTVL